MAKKFANLSDEQKALHGSWDDVGRVALVVAVGSLLVWGLCAALKTGVHAVADGLLAWVAREGTWRSAAVLAGALIATGVIRGVLHRLPDWQNVERDGIDVALRNYHLTYADDVDDPRPRFALPAFGTALRKVAATFLTLAGGGSGGIEGPVVLIGESAGAGIARVFASRSEHELRTYQLAGVAAAVSTLLNAPFTAALFAIEIVYGDRIIYRKFAYALLAATIAYVLNARLLGYHPIFVAPAHAATYTLEEYGVSALVAVAVSAPLALGFGLTMRHTRALADRIPAVARGAAGGACTAIVALGLAVGAGIDVRHTLGMGDFTLRQLLAETPPAELGVWWVLLLAAFGRMLTTGLTIHTGGSAGLLIPSMFLGGVAGAMTAHVFHRFGLLLDLDPSLFVVVGVASSLVAMVGVPIAAIALVLEVFGAAYGPPAILACGVTYVLTLRLTVYDEQKKSPTPLEDEIGAAPTSDRESESDLQPGQRAAGGEPISGDPAGAGGG